MKRKILVSVIFALTLSISGCSANNYESKKTTKSTQTVSSDAKIVTSEITDTQNFESKETNFENTETIIVSPEANYTQSSEYIERDYSKLPNLYEKECADPDVITLDFTGDIGMSERTPITRYYDSVKHKLNKCISQNLIDELRSADITTVNNEFTYSKRGKPVPNKPYTFRTKPSRVKILQDLGVDLAGLANNHVFDYQEKALYDTMKTLKKADIPYVGAGKNLKEASTPAYFLANGKIIAICAATQVERSTNHTQEATKNKPGVMKTLNSKRFCKEIKKAKKNADVVIVFVHWGLEGSIKYQSDQVALAKDFVDAGADAIIGGHTHGLQGISYIDDVPVIYSLGNFWFNTHKRDTGIAKLYIDKDNKITMQFIPCKTANCKTKLVTKKSEKKRILKYMRKLSKGVSIDSKGFVSKKKKRKK